jgi:GNAT superfamily N-acetyltransferase
MIVKLNKNYLKKYSNRITLLLMNIKFISYEFAENICEKIKNDINTYSNNSYLYIEDDTIAGMIMAKSAGNNVPDKSTCEIEYLSVNPDYKGQGIATSLVEHLKKKCNGSFDCLYLTVYENNSGAIAFYEKMGFSPYILNGKLQTVIRDGGTSIEHTDICMICDLPAI